MQKLIHFTVSRKLINKNSRGDDLGALPPHNCFGRGGDRPHRCYGVGDSEATVTRSSGSSCAHHRTASATNSSLSAILMEARRRRDSCDNSKTRYFPRNFPIMFTPPGPRLQARRTGLSDVCVSCCV